MLALPLQILACCGVVLYLIFYGQSHFYRDPGSIFFDIDRAYEEKYSRYRTSEIQDFIDLQQQDVLLDEQSGRTENASLCIALSSVKRARTVYLEHTIGSLLHGLTDEERADFFLSVLIAQTEPNQHPSWTREWLRRVVDDLYTYNVSEEQLLRLKKMEKAANFAEKGVHDYVYALQRCHRTGTPYIAMFEDDVALADGWLVRALLGLQRISTLNPDSNRWLFMRLFNQERSMGWANRRIGGNHEFLIIPGIALGISSAVLLIRRRWRATRRYLTLELLFVVVLLLNPALVILFFQCGKISLLPPAPGVVEEPYGCCSQALVFPRAQVPRVVRFLEQQGKGQIDLLLDDLAKEEGLKRYALYPVLAQHRGVDSARETKASEAQAIWSVAYEDLDPVMLERTHRQMVKDYYS